MVGPGPAGAQSSAPVLPDSTRIAAPDTVGTGPDAPGAGQIRVTAPGDTAALTDSAAVAAERALELAREERRARRTGRKPGRFDAPRYVMMRSLLAPGWGQFHNRAWIKGVAVAAGEVALIAKLVEDERELERRSDAVDEAQLANDPDRFALAVERYNDLLNASIGRRWLLGGLLTYALVDAYVDAHFRGFHVDLTPAGGATAGARLGIGWRF